MDNKFTDYYRLGGVGGIKIGRNKFKGVKEIPWDIQRSICVNPSKKIIYFKPGKAAGTSIFRVLLQPMGGWIIQKDNPQKFYNWMSQITDKEFNSYFKFIFVRNPYDRLVSVWNDKKHVYRLSKNFKDFVMNKNSIFIDQVPKYLHLQTQSSLVETTSGLETNLDFVGKVESINKDWKDLCSCIKIPHKPMVHAQARRHKYYKLYYDDETVEMVQKLYKRDFEKFNYSKIL
tara:strand:+ start:874 stop:1566 length:693 start_codon:yes stop_codon:yes gene_type:complete